MAAVRRAKRKSPVLLLEIPNFLKYLSDTKGLSANTVAAYGNDLNQFAKFLDDRGFDSWNADRTAISEFLSFLADREYEPSSQARKLAAVKEKK
jgi:integrase/recombinase XerD